MRRRDVESLVRDYDDSGRHAAVATLVRARGKSPSPAGTKLWLEESGNVVGTVTLGGCVDARVIEAAGRVIDGGKSEVLELDLATEEALAMGLTCGGTVVVLVEPANFGSVGDAADSYRAVERGLSNGADCVRAVPLDGVAGDWITVRSDGVVRGSFESESVRSVAERVLQAADSTVDEVDGRQFFFEFHRPQPRLLIVGASEVAVRLVPMAEVVGFHVVVIDPRERFVTRDRFPDASELHPGIASEILKSHRLDRSAALVLLAHDYKIELPVLRMALKTEIGYVGMLAGRKRAARIRQMLIEDGVDENAVNGIRAPVGVDIGARTAGEIALSILSEIVSNRAGVVDMVSLSR